MQRKTRAEIPVVQTAFTASLGSRGAPGSEPGTTSRASPCDLTPKGSTAKRTIHHVVK